VIDELAALLAPEDDGTPLAELWPGDVTDASVWPPLIQTGHSDTAVPTPCVGYWPVTGDHVEVLIAGAVRVCIGRPDSNTRTFTPTVTISGGTNPNLGTTGTATGRYEVGDGWCTAAAVFAFAGTGMTAGTGAGLPYNFSVPVPPQGWSSSSVVTRGDVVFQRSNTVILDSVALIGTVVQARLSRDNAGTRQIIGPDEIAFVGAGPIAGSVWTYQVRYQVG